MKPSGFSFHFKITNFIFLIVTELFKWNHIVWVVAAYAFWAISSVHQSSWDLFFVENFYFFIYFKYVCNCLLKHFLDTALKSCQLTMTFVLSWCWHVLSFLIWVETLLLLDIFSIETWIFEVLWDSGSYLNIPLQQASSNTPLVKKGYSLITAWHGW